MGYSLNCNPFLLLGSIWGSVFSEFREVRGGNYGVNNPIWSLINRGVAEV